MAVHPPIGASSRKVVRAAPDRRRGAGDHQHREGDEAAADDERRRVDGGGVAGVVHDRDAGERAQPRGPGQRAADVDAAPVVHLGDAPADPQRPAPRSPARKPEQHVEDVLLADEDRGGEVHERQRRERGQRAAVVGPPAAAIEVVQEHAEVDQHHAGHRPVVGHQPRAVRLRSCPYD
jgi:hypothetical protein